MSRVIEHFKKITKIPHCSKDAKRLKEYIADYAKSKGYSVECDEADNILVSKGKASITLQAHYDMVCVGKAPDIEIYEDDGWLKAKDSSLGADNGIAIAMMLSLMDSGVEAEFLFTSDEEIGLIGAKALSLKPKAKRLLNLDYESEGAICIGCAGGVDIVGKKEIKRVDFSGECFEVSISKLPGGHSGVDIDKNIPSAIIELSKYLSSNKIDALVSFEGGERRNSIPVSAKALVYSSKELEPKDNITIKKIDSNSKAIKDGLNILDYLAKFNQGVREFNDNLNIPHSSINLAIVSSKQDSISIALSARAMDNNSLDKLSKETQEELEAIGFEVKEEDRYPSWKPVESDFAKEICQYMQDEFGDCKIEAIHAGLECGILSEKLPGVMMASIGPTIENPHSIRERVDIESIERVYKVVERVISKLDSV